MQTKKYSSYAQIDRELEILKIEKEISYQKLVFNIQKTKESFTFLNLTTNVIDSVKSTFFSSYATVLRILIPIIIKWFRHKKRGD
ncbi:hypothetical protein SAMN05192550_0575 [Flavobacterium glycines]|uniref:Glutaminyl-tRNA synthetase n=1 Tax=Flavobacterium glycines TaxID=551990 RepID=A0A1B9DNX7_9FLAO|nr:DUF6327 family protein [Flavobacterium glycines]OCB71373.1 hypothetical protein FBGL_09010 [Flavobacterium glycines]GEL10391.1 hypothetical protein FGL01_11300 [Flavobacterium glycines]SDI70026.1 hypothetical protein SAMN05192550_0575 [Flavobacterium glycines]